MSSPHDALISSGGGAGEVSRSGKVGGGSGDEFDDGFPTADNEVHRVMAWAGGLVDAIQFSYREKGAEIEKYAAAKHGGGGTLKFNHQMQAGEYIIALVGRHGTEIDSIEVHTNRGTYQRVGGNSGYSDYAFEGRPADELNEIVGLLGNAGHHLDQLGVYIRTRTE